MYTTILAHMPDVSVHMYWYMGRSSGFIAYWLLFASMGMGLAVSSRIFDGMLARPWVFELHRFLSVFVLVVMTFHGLIMLPDPYAKFTLKELLVPFQSHYKNFPMAVGIVTLYTSAFITATFYFKGLIGQNAWRMIHYATFALFVGALAHGVWAGTDTRMQYVQFSYLASGIGLVFLTFFRMLAAKSAAKKAPAPSAAPKPKAAPEQAISGPAA
jgi:predicted ferric reductase